MTENQKLAIMARGLAGTLVNRSMHKVVDGDKSVVLSLAEAAIWQEELVKISQALQSLDGGEGSDSLDALNKAQIRDLQDQVRADGFKSQNPIDSKAFLDESSGDL